MSQCSLCEKEKQRNAGDASQSMCAGYCDGGGSWVCADCVAAPARADKYRKALEEIKRSVSDCDDYHSTLNYIDDVVDDALREE